MVCGFESRSSHHRAAGKIALKNRIRLPAVPALSFAMLGWAELFRHADGFDSSGNV
jgi:hypothetical protein